MLLVMMTVVSMMVHAPLGVSAASAISLNVPFFCQRSYGVCVNSSISMVEAYYHGYGQNNDYVYNAVMNYNPGAALSSANAAYLGYAPISCDLQSVYNALASGKPVIIQRDGHFSVVYAYVPTSTTLQRSDFKVLNTFRTLEGYPTVVGPEFSNNVGYSDMASWLSGNTWLTAWVKVSDKIPISSTTSTVKELTISGVNYPIHKQSGQPFEVFGTISSPNVFDYAQALVYDSNNALIFGIGLYRENGSKVLNINTYDAKMTFASLPDGNYKYVVNAADYKGYHAEIIKYFTVGPGGTTSGSVNTVTGTHSCDYDKLDPQYSWDAGVVTKSATCSNIGVKTYTCRECGKTKTEDIPTVAHDYQLHWTVDIEPTEQSVGYKSRHCNNCSATIDVTEIPTLETSMPFVDVNERDWFYSAVKYAVDNEIFNGVGANSFAPNASMTRAMLVTVLYRMEGVDAVSGQIPFVDVKSDTWYSGAVLWAANEGIVNGVTKTTFAPNANLTREQLVTILYRYSARKGYDISAVSNLAKYPDCGNVSSFAMDALSWANAVGIISGTEIGGVAYIDPKGNATRAQVATILMRYNTVYLASVVDPENGADEEIEIFRPSGPVEYVPYL